MASQTVTVFSATPLADVLVTVNENHHVPHHEQDAGFQQAGHPVERRAGQEVAVPVRRHMLASADIQEQRIFKIEDAFSRDYWKGRSKKRNNASLTMNWS